MISFWTNFSTALERQHLTKNTMKGIDKASSKAADPEADDGSDDDEDRFKIDSKQPHEGANETFVPAINHATDQMRAADEAEKDAEG